MKITRKNYLAGKCTHEEYYSAVAKDARINYKDSLLLPRIKKALKKGDKHLNTIPLAGWNVSALFTKEVISKALKKRGDFWSLAGGVCTHKQAAKNAINK